MLIQKINDYSNYKSEITWGNKKQIRLMAKRARFAIIVMQQALTDSVFLMDKLDKSNYNRQICTVFFSKFYSWNKRINLNLIISSKTLL